MTTGMRQGELLALRFNRLDLDEEVIDLRHNWVRDKKKDTRKTHQDRRIALDAETIVLLKKHQSRVKQRIESLGTARSDRNTWFRIETRSLVRIIAHGQPVDGIEASAHLDDVAKPGWHAAVTWLDEDTVWRADEVECPGNAHPSGSVTGRRVRTATCLAADLQPVTQHPGRASPHPNREPAATANRTHPLRKHTAHDGCGSVTNLARC